MLHVRMIGESLARSIKLNQYHVSLYLHDLCLSGTLSPLIEDLSQLRLLNRHSSSNSSLTVDNIATARLQYGYQLKINIEYQSPHKSAI
jgi:hypothetical protein